MSWKADTVEKTFENYQRDYQKYCGSLDKLEETQKEWKEKDAELSGVRKRIAGIEREIAKIQAEEVPLYEEEAQKIELASMERMWIIEEELEEKRAQFGAWKERELEENSRDLERVLKEMLLRMGRRVGRKKTGKKEKERKVPERKKVPEGREALRKALPPAALQRRPEKI